MKDLTTKGLGATSGVSKLFNIGKADKTANAGKIGTIQMTGVYASGGELSIRPKSSTVIPQTIVDKYDDVAFAGAPRGKAPQLVIADADYIPDKEYADAEV